MNRNKKNIILVAIGSLVIGFGVGSAFQNASQYVSFNLNKPVTSDISINNSGGVPKLPVKLDFAGEAVPLKDIEVRERLDREISSIHLDIAVRLS